LPCVVDKWAFQANDSMTNIAHHGLVASPAAAPPSEKLRVSRATGGAERAAADLRGARVRCAIALDRAAGAHDRFAVVLERAAARGVGDHADKLRRATQQRAAAAVDREGAADIRRALD
jgi:hypothetical protein